MSHINSNRVSNFMTRFHFGQTRSSSSRCPGSVMSPDISFVLLLLQPQGRQPYPKSFLQYGSATKFMLKIFFGCQPRMPRTCWTRIFYGNAGMNQNAIWLVGLAPCYLHYNMACFDTSRVTADLIWTVSSFSFLTPVSSQRAHLSRIWTS